jgi:uncharacterized membrane protein YphA (DoxX/SURF4 family)
MQQDVELLLAKPNKKLMTCTGWAVFFMVLLRIAIGWHFFYEGIWKLQQPDWRATSYLVMSIGPLRPYFSGQKDLPVIGPMVKDANGLEQLSARGTQKLMDDRSEQLIKYYAIADQAMLDRIKAFKDTRNAAAEKDPAYADFIADASTRLAGPVTAGFTAAQNAIAAATSQPAELFAETDVKAAIQAALARQTAGFTATQPATTSNEILAAAVDSFLGDRDFQNSLALLKQGFASDVRNFKMAYVESMFADAEFSKQIDDYKTLLKELEEYEKQIGTTGYNKERLLDQYARRAKSKAACIAVAEKPLKDLDAFVLAELTKSYTDAKAAGDPKADEISKTQLAKPLPYYPSPTRFIDWSNMIALTLIGAGLMLGLFTRLSAVGGIGLLMLYYWCMPSLPWLPEAGPTEGHYLFINKNIIEALALAMIATSGVGRWCGLDGILFRSRRIAKAAG